MLFMTDYQLKPNMSKADATRMMDEFGSRGAAEGEIAHYVRVEGTGGYVISENESLESAYADVLAYSEFMTVSIHPLLKVDDAVGPILAYLG